MNIAVFKNLIYISRSISHDRLRGHETIIQLYNTTYNTPLLPSVNTIALGMFCGAKFTHHTLTPIIKHHQITTTANKQVQVKRHS